MPPRAPDPADAAGADAFNPGPSRELDDALAYARRGFDLKGREGKLLAGEIDRLRALIRRRDV